MKLLFQRIRPHLLPLWEGSERKRQNRVARNQNQTQIDRGRVPRVLLQPLPLLQPDQQQRRDDHDGRAVQHPTDGGLPDRDGGGLLALAQGFQIPRAFFRRCRRNGEHVDARADLLASHQKDVERSC